MLGHLRIAGGNAASANTRAGVEGAFATAREHVLERAGLVLDGPASRVGREGLGGTVG